MRLDDPFSFDWFEEEKKRNEDGYDDVDIDKCGLFYVKKKKQNSQQE